MYFHNEERVNYWINKYVPVRNTIDPYSSWEGTMFETYGEQYKRVLDTVNAPTWDGERHVWTWVDTDEGTAIVAGFHYVNRIGYFITENPWSDHNEYVEVTKDIDEDNLVSESN